MVLVTRRSQLGAGESAATMNSQLVLQVSEFVAFVNQTLEVAYPFVAVEGEVSSFRVSKGKWVNFDLKDAVATVRCFTTVYALSGPLEDGMMVRVTGAPRLHPLYNFTFNVQTVTPVGEGTLRRQADLLRAKLEAEGLFDLARKRVLPAVPRHIALVASGQSAAYADFIKIARARWGGLMIDHFEVQVQGDAAPEQIVMALTTANAMSDLPEVVVLIRGGGSAEDLAAFSDERVVRAVAASRVPTLVAIGHEVDVALAELAADVRASTPSNAAESLLPDRVEEQRHLGAKERAFDTALSTFIVQKRQHLAVVHQQLGHRLERIYAAAREQTSSLQRLLTALDPRRPLEQGYALVRSAGGIMRRAAEAHTDEGIEIEFVDGTVAAQVKSVKRKGA